MSQTEITEDEKDSDQELHVTAFLQITLEGNWEEVIRLYNTNKNACRTNINKSRGTALHVAVSDGDNITVKRLVEAIIEKENENEDEVINILTMENAKGDTPLHLAASRGFRDMCMYIVGEKGERKNLVSIRNKKGETPLFLAALSWHKQAFAYLYQVHQECKISTIASRWWYMLDLVRSDGDSILHWAIRNEFLDLALIIVNDYPDLGGFQNKDGYTPLRLLATRSSAFKSGSTLRWWKQIVYNSITVDRLDCEKAIESYKLRKDEDNAAPQNYLTCYNFFSGLLNAFGISVDRLDDQKARKSSLPRKDGDNAVPQKKLTCYNFFSRLRNPFGVTVDGQDDEKAMKSCIPRKDEDNAVPQNKLTCHNFFSGLRNAFGRSAEEKNQTLPLTVPPNYATCHQFARFACLYIVGHLVGLSVIRKMKQKHIWADQLLNKLMTDNIYDWYVGMGGVPLEQEDEEEDQTDPFFARENVKNEAETMQEKNKEKKHAAMIDRKETLFLVAARYGIVEIVTKVQSLLPSAYHDTNLEKKNVLLVVVENKRPRVLQALRKSLRKEVWDNLIRGVDNQENNALHLAAKAASDKDTPWLISGHAMQMMWEVKWFQYIKELVPDHFNLRINKENKTAGEIFNEAHDKLVKDSGKWLKDTSESCSLVAALNAGVSFATASTVPGGTVETGQPALIGRPAFNSFAIASLIGLSFSVTGLIMFLSVLTSRKQAKDFSKDLPLKLFLGLSSLFVSIAALFVSFCSGNFFEFGDKYRQILLPVYAATCLPVSFFAIAQFPLYIDLRTIILSKVPEPGDKGKDL